VLGPVARVQDALDLARAARPDAAVLDVNLFGDTVGPVADALDGMGVPFVLCTGYHSPGAVGERHARAPVLVKPVGGGELVAAVGNLLVRESP
jgi:DNA-binding response OmpR family regulator